LTILSCVSLRHAIKAATTIYKEKTNIHFCRTAIPKFEKILAKKNVPTIKNTKENLTNNGACFKNLKKPLCKSEIVKNKLTALSILTNRKLNENFSKKGL
jgi:hypothetical protein